MVFVYTAIGVLCVEHANVLELCYIELLSGDSSFRLYSLVASWSLIQEVAGGNFYCNDKYFGYSVQ